MSNNKSALKRFVFLIFWFFAYSITSFAQQKPNIIYILVDDLGYGDLGVLFQNQKNKELPRLNSPHLDHMAAAGAVLTQQYANAPVCAPSRASLLTGVNQGNAHVRDNQFDKALENNHTIATVLKNTGYSTVAIGKWGLQGTEAKEKPNWPAHPLKRGFDYYFGYMRHADGHEHYPVEGVYRGKKEVWEDEQEVSNGLEKCYTTDLWTAKAKEYIIDFEKAHFGTKPFFMYLAYDAPHAVLELPTQAYPTGGGIAGGLKWLGQKGKMINTASGSVDSYVHPDYANAMYDDDKNPNTPNVPWPDTYKRYATAVRRIDDAVGDLRKLLSDLKIEDNTVIVFTSDNGPSIESYLPESFVANKPTFFESYGPFDGIKRDCWEGGLRMPVLAVWPKHISSGKVVNTPSMLSDWLPTFAEMAKTPVPVRTTGVSLLPALTGKGMQENSLVYAEYFEGRNTPNFSEFEPNHANRKRNQMQMLRVGDFVGVRYDVKSAGDDFEIYNVVKDPKEKTNLAKQSAFKKIQIQMKAKALQARIADVEAPRPYDHVAVPGIAISKATKKGIGYSFFNGNYAYIPSLNTAQASNTENFKSLADAKEKQQGIAVFKTFVEIPETGIYTFKLATHGKAFVKLHQFNLIDADFGYQSGEEIEARVTLEKGYHPLTLFYLKSKAGKDDLSFQFRKQMGNWQSLDERNCVF